MSNVSLIYDGIVSLVETELTTYTRLADAYDVENNGILSLVKGFSISFGDGLNTERTITCAQLSTARSFVLTLTNLYTANDNDPIGRANVEKQLMNDLMLIAKAFQSVHYLGGVQVAAARYVDDGGLEYLDTEDNKAISVVATFSAEYFE